jgi:hypothetical protein
MNNDVPLTLHETPDCSFMCLPASKPTETGLEGGPTLLP